MEIQIKTTKDTLLHMTQLAKILESGNVKYSKEIEK